jgi:hypothetical protein
MLIGFSSNVFAKDTTDCIKIKDDTKRLACFDGIFSSSSDVIAYFEGQGMTNTQPFITKDSWSIYWEYTADEESPFGQIFTITIKNQKAEVVDANVVYLGGTSSGVSYYPKKGKYYLLINAGGSWKVKIVPST